MYKNQVSEDKKFFLAIDHISSYYALVCGSSRKVSLGEHKLIKTINSSSNNIRMLSRIIHQI